MQASNFIFAPMCWQRSLLIPFTRKAIIDTVA